MASLLYPSSTTRISVDAFRDQIKNDPDSFARFKVLRLTHIKDLANWVWHEYVQMIVRDTSNNKLHRILVERVPSNDNVIIGMWSPWTEGEAPSSGNSDTWFPLPLLSLFFHTPLALFDVANHLCAVRAVHKDYHLLWANCYWYAISVYNSLYASAGSTATQKSWFWSGYRGVPPTYVTIFDMVTNGPKLIAATSFKNNEMKDLKVMYNTKDAPDVDDIKDVSDMDVSGMNDIEDDPAANTLHSRLLTFTREIFKGQISEAECEEATVDFPMIGEIDADNDRGSEDSKAILHAAQLIGNGVSGEVSDDQSRTPYAEEVRAFCQGFLNDPAMKEHVESVSGDRFDEVFLPLKVDNIPPECQEGLAELGPEWRLSQEDCDNLNLVLKATVSAVQKMLAEN